MDSTWKKILEQLKMETYISAIEDEKFDDDSFFQLTEQQLTLFIPAMGHRLKLVNHLKALRESKVFICFICNIGMTNYKSLLLHFKNHPQLTEESLYACTHCKAQMHRKTYFQHMRNFFKCHADIAYDSLSNEVLEDFDDEANEARVESDLETEFIEPENFTDNDRVIHEGACFIATILESGKVPVATGKKILDKAKQLISLVVASCKALAQQAFNEGNISVLEGMDLYKNPFTKIGTTHKLNKYLDRKGLLIIPKEISIDSDIHYEMKGGSVSQVYRQVAVQHVPIRDTLIQLFKKKGFHDILRLNQTTSAEIFEHFRDGELFKQMNLPVNCILINIYHDEVEIANPLGSKSGKHKIANFYFHLADMPPYMLSSVKNKFLVASVKARDMKLCSPNVVVRIIVDELKVLWQNGMDVCLGDSPHVTITNFKVVLAQWLGDNLGVHGIFGFVEGFTANYPCRKCKMEICDCHTSIVEDAALLRNEQNYMQDLQTNDISQTGVKFNSVLNELPYFSTLTNHAPDIMHDIMEGVVPDLLRHLLNHVISENVITLDMLNHRLESFNYGHHYKCTKPSLIKAQFLKGETTSGQNASQNLCLMVCLPLLLGDLVHTESTFWKLFLLLREILDLIMTPRITNAGILHLGLLISEFLSRYQDTTHRNLKPKHHHLTHYKRAIKQIGPLKQYWCMTFESVHKFFKITAHASCNFKNITKTSCYRYQLQKCYQLMTIDSFEAESLIHKDPEDVWLANLGQHAKIVRENMQIWSNGRGRDSVAVVNSCEYNGMVYRIGCYVIFDYVEGNL